MVVQDEDSMSTDLKSRPGCFFDSPMHVWLMWANAKNLPTVLNILTCNLCPADAMTAPIGTQHAKWNSFLSFSFPCQKTWKLQNDIFARTIYTKKIFLWDCDSEKACHLPTHISLTNSTNNQELYLLSQNCMSHDSIAFSMAQTKEPNK